MQAISKENGLEIQRIGITLVQKSNLINRIMDKEILEALNAIRDSYKEGYENATKKALFVRF